MNCPYLIKICKRCNKILIVSDINFNKKKTGKYGYNSKCKICVKEERKEYYNEHREEAIEKQKRYYNSHKEDILEYKKEYHKEHKEEKAEYDKLYREKNKEKRNEKNKEYYQEHKEERAEYNKQWRENNPQNCFNRHVKRRQSEENQGRGITKEQWLEMMEFFEWKCAYSNISLTKENRSVDHVVALNNNGEHEVWNCVPMYANYNYSKKDKDMEEWYQQQEFYSEERLIKIYAWREYAWNKWKPRRKGNKKNQ